MEINRRFSILLVVAVVVSSILFSGSLNGKFTLDDHDVIERRVELRELKNLPKYGYPHGILVVNGLVITVL